MAEIVQVLDDVVKHKLIDMDITQIAAKVREHLKEQYPKCTFSVTIERYSMGQSLHVSLMKSNFQVMQKPEELSELAIFKYTENGRRTLEQLKANQLSKYHQLGNFYNYEKYDKDTWDNGVFLTEKGFDMFMEVCDYIRQFNWDNSDPMTDYYDVHFYLHLNIGKWDKPYEEVA